MGHWQPLPRQHYGLGSLCIYVGDQPLYGTQETTKMNPSGHSHPHDPKPVDPALPLIQLIHPTLLKIQAGILPTDPPMTAADVALKLVAILAPPTIPQTTDGAP
jgi:hypothetical protein